MRIFMAFLYLCLILLGASFAVLNAEVVHVNVYYTTLSMPLSVLMIAMLCIGLILGFLAFLARYWRLKRAYSKIKAQWKAVEKTTSLERS